jgi:hypothetical protein
MKIKEAIEKVNKQAGKEVVISKNPTMGDSKLTIETTNGEIVLVQVDGDGVVSTPSRTYFVTNKYGLDEIFNTIHGMCGEYKNVVGKEYSNNFGSIQKCDDGTWVRNNLVVGLCVGYSRCYNHAIEWMRLNAQEYRDGKSGLSVYF